MRSTLLRGIPCILAVLCVALPACGPARAQSAAEREVRARREALLKAVNAHDAKALRSFVDPGIRFNASDGRTVTYDELMASTEKLFKTTPDFKEACRIEKIEVKGNEARITVSETDTFTDQNGKKQTVNDRLLETWQKKAGKWLLVAQKDL